MKYYLFISLFLLYSRIGFPQITEKNSISGRTILIFSPEVSNLKYKNQIQLLSRNPIGLDKRKISILEIFPSGGIKSDGSEMEDSMVIKFRTDYKISISEFRIILLDTNESVIINRPEVIEEEKLFDIIDSQLLK
jgi:hypothetical protein